MRAVLKNAQDTEVGSILMSFEYDKFKHLTGNRKINKANLARITQSMKENHMISPMVVNEKYEIIDGQHRHLAQKNLNLPCYYFVQPGLGLKDVQRLNRVNKTWGFRDYLDSYCEQGFVEYLKVRRFMQDNPDFSIKPTLALLRLTITHGLSRAADRESSNVFADGTFKCVDLSRSYELAAQIMQLKPLTELYKSSNFVNAFIVTSRKDEFDFMNFKHKVRMFPDKLYECTNTQNYIDMIEKLYNYRNQNKVSLRY